MARTARATETAKGITRRTTRLGAIRPTSGVVETKWIHEVDWVACGIGVSVQGLWIEDASGEGVGGGEAAQAIDGGAHDGVVIAGFGIALVGGEFELGGGAGGVPVFAEWEMGLLADDSARGISGDARGEVIGDVVVGGGAGGRPRKGGEELRAGVDVLLRRRRSEE